VMKNIGTSRAAPLAEDVPLPPSQTTVAPVLSSPLSLQLEPAASGELEPPVHATTDKHVPRNLSRHCIDSAPSPYNVLDTSTQIPTILLLSQHGEVYTFPSLIYRGQFPESSKAASPRSKTHRTRRPSRRLYLHCDGASTVRC
jgi:hypothetical protein